MQVTFPVLVLEKDSGDILKFESLPEMQGYLERIDVENNEYAAWDADGHSVTLMVQEPVWLKIVPGPEAGEPDLRESLKRLAQSSQIRLTADEQRLPALALYNVISAKGGTKRKTTNVFRSRR